MTTYEVVEGSDNVTEPPIIIDAAAAENDTIDDDESASIHNHHTANLEITESLSSASILRPNSSMTEDQRISWFDASMHLIKGNLGPGCLNIPHAFVISGWIMGIGLFFVVALQGIYSMFILTYCKSLLQDKQAHTFMDVAKEALGRKGQRTVQALLFIMQAGVCCVFLSLIATNLQAEFGLESNAPCVLMVTVALLAVVLLRFMKDLRWQST